MMKILATIFGVVSLNLLSSEIYSWLDSLSKKIVGWSANRMPPDLQVRFEEEWEGVLLEIPGSLAKLMFACGCCIAALKTPRSISLPPDRITSKSALINRQIIAIASSVAGELSTSEYAEMNMNQRTSYVCKRLGEITLSDSEDYALEVAASDLFKSMLSEATEERRILVELSGKSVCRAACICAVIHYFCGSNISPPKGE